MAYETPRWWLDQEWLNQVGWTGSSAQTVPCAPSHQRCTQCVCVVFNWLLPVNPDMVIASASKTVYNLWATQIIICIV